MKQYSCPLCHEADTLIHSTGWMECLSCFYSNVISEFKQEETGNYFADDEPFDDGG
jgi:hypothetical protein